jgi:hypothetical protein
MSDDSDYSDIEDEFIGRTGVSLGFAGNEVLSQEMTPFDSHLGGQPVSMMIQTYNFLVSKNLTIDMVSSRV